MCFCNLAYKTGLNRLGEGMEGSLHFLGSAVLAVSLIRMFIYWFFGI